MKIRGKNQQNGEWKIIVVGFEWRGFLFELLGFQVNGSFYWTWVWKKLCNKLKKNELTSRGFEPRIERFSLFFTSKFLNSKLI
jgi:hypothetical protein